MISDAMFKILFYISSYLFLSIYVGFFEKHYQTRVSESQNALVMVLLLFLSILFSFQMNVNTLILVSVLLYGYLHAAFLFTSKKDIIVNFVFYITGLLVLLMMYSFIQCFYYKNMEQSTSLSVISLLVSSILFYFLEKYEDDILHLQILYKLKYQDLWIITILTIFFFIISFVLFYFSFLYDTLLFEMFSFIVIVFLLVTLFSFLYMIEKLWKGYEAEANLKQIEYNERLNYAYYKRREEVEQEVSYLLHDMKNHLQIVNNMTETNTYLKQIQRQIEEKDLIRYSPRHILQILFHDKVYYAQRKQIQIHIHSIDITLDFISDFDLVTIFSNLLDNAIEAVEKMHISQRMIHIHIKEIRQMIVITVKNPMHHALKKDKIGKLLTTKKHHQGLGLTSVQNAIKKYDGDMQIQQEEGYFIVTIVLQKR